MTVEQAIQALHAVISRKPHSAAVRAHPDQYNAWTSEIEQAANAVRDAYEVERRERAAP